MNHLLEAMAVVTKESMVPEDILNFHEVLLSYCGMLPPKKAGNLVTASFPFLTTAVLLSILLMMASLIIAVYKEWEDLEAASMAFCILCGYTATFGNSFCFVLSRNRVLKLVEEMRFRFIRCVPTKYSHLPVLADRTDKMVTLLSLVMYVVCGLAWVIAPLMKRWSQDDTKIWEKFAYPTWVPFDINKSPASEIVFAWQIFSISLGVYTICCLDTFFAAIMHQVCVQFTILSQLFSDVDNIDISAHKTIGITFTMINNDENKISTRYKLTNEKYLLECIKKHQDILEFFKRANAVTSVANVFQLANIPFVLCITGFHMLLAKSTWDDCIKQGALSSVTLIKLLLLCWYGQKLNDQSLEINKAMYNCNWVNQSLPFKKLMAMVVMRSQRPVKFSAWLFYDTISFATFTAVLNTTYSYFTLLRQIRD